MSLHKTPVEYHFPQTVEAACALKKRYGEKARFIAGGTDLLLLMERDGYHPQALIDLNRIPSLKKLSISDRWVSIGAAVTYSEILACQRLCEEIPFFAKAIRTIGGVQVRNVATLAGNIANASPAADTLPPLYVLNAKIHTTSLAGAREKPIEQFILGVRRVALEPTEFITHITFDLPEQGYAGDFDKLGVRRAMAISVVSVAILLYFKGHLVKEARLALGSVAPTVLRVAKAETALAGNPLSYGKIEEATQISCTAAQPIDDVRASANYRQQAVAGVVRRALRRLCGSLR